MTRKKDVYNKELIPAVKKLNVQDKLLTYQREAISAQREILAVPAETWKYKLPGSISPFRDYKGHGCQKAASGTLYRM